MLHTADSVRNLTGVCFGNHPASCVRNTASDALFGPCAGGVRNLASAGLLNHVADRVGNLTRAGFGHERAGGVWNLFHTLYRDLATDGVRHFAMADFGHHASAGDRFLHHFGDPFAAADGRSRALNANFFAAAGVAGIANAFFYDWSGDMAGFGDPFATAFFNSTALGYRLERSVADVFPAGLRFCFPAGGANIAVAGLIDRLADIVANRAIAGLVNWFADCVADVAIAGLVDRLSYAAGDVAIAGLVDGFADRVIACFVAGLVDRLANGIAFITKAGFVDVFDTAHRFGFGAVVEDRFCAVVLLGFPHDFLLHAAVCGSTATSGDEITAGRACGRRTAEESARTEQTGHQNSAVQQYRNCSSGSQHEPIHCLTSIISGRLKRFRTKGGESPASVSSPPSPRLDASEDRCIRVPQPA